MEFRVLGQIEVIEDGRRLAVASGRQLALLALLIVHANRVISAERIIDELWGDEPPESGAKTVAFHVSRLRDALEPGRQRGSPSAVLVTERAGYVLRIEPDQVDAVRFDRLASEGRALLADDPDAARGRLGEALDLWRGEPYADLADESFVQPEIRRLDELRLRTLDDLFESDLGLGTVSADGAWPAAEGGLYGATFAIESESLVWYPAAAFERAGYAVPRTWDELKALTARMVADGRTPWCLGVEAAADSGAGAADVVEDLVLHGAGPDVYDEWASGRLRFVDPAVRAGFVEFGHLAFRDGYVLGGVASAIRTPEDLAAWPMFADPPGWRHSVDADDTQRVLRGVSHGTDADQHALPGGAPQGHEGLTAREPAGAARDDGPSTTGPKPTDRHARTLSGRVAALCHSVRSGLRQRVCPGLLTPAGASCIVTTRHPTTHPSAARFPMPTPVHFEIHATDPDAARSFYGALFGWTFEQFGDMSYWLIRTGGGQGRDGGLLLRGTDAPEAGRSPNAFVVTFDVEDCDATVGSAVAAGAGVAMPADDMPGIGRLAYLIDPDGNIFGVLQPAM